MFGTLLVAAVTSAVVVAAAVAIGYKIDQSKGEIMATQQDMLDEVTAKLTAFAADLQRLLDAFAQLSQGQLSDAAAAQFQAIVDKVDQLDSVVNTDVPPPPAPPAG